ncbi:hypothetical protein [Acidovorax sp. BLS4]|uniref:hypothetical protein n=1 Tax=Acidovorax sp. BLS4 TaxID=3273430 RepID=UPI002941EE68|nr:hypothetical protein [Paracidovorax avenae]WOI44385.1 hypothetical protein R1Z03_17870 [Paracidovorax avenae]
MSSAPTRPSGLAGQLSPLRSALPKAMAEKPPAAADPAGAASPSVSPSLTPFVTAPSSPAIHSRHSSSEIQPEPATRPVPRSTLGALFEQARQQERTERNQLLHLALPHGGRAMKRLKERAGRETPVTMADKWRARLNGPPKPMEGRRREAFVARVRADAMAVAKAGQLDARVAVDRIRMAVEDGTLGQNVLKEDRELLLEVLCQLADPADHLYRQLNLKITPDTRLAYTDAQVLEKPKHLTSGSFASVFALKVQNADGVAQDSVFKPLKATEKGWVGSASGIPMDDPQVAIRNIATLSCAKKLGLDVIADTRLALIDTGRGPLDPDLGLLMERAPGKQASNADADWFKNPAVFAEVTKLQLLDHLTGQVDRHDNNYFIDVGPNGDVKVTGIDNDQCFGKDLRRPSDIRPRSGLPFYGTALPPVIDTTMAAMIDDLVDDELHAMLDNQLSDDEVEATGSRLQGLRLHVDQLRGQGLVIEPGQWADTAIQARFTAQNSYIGRERTTHQVF